MVTFFVLEVPDYESAILIHTHTHTHTHTYVCMYVGSSRETVAFQVYEILKIDHEFLQFF